jgi:hypothetical protein
MQPADPLDTILRRSDDLHQELARRVPDDSIEESDRFNATLGMCSVSLEHAHGLRALIANGCPTSAISLLRLQFESLTRAMWILYVAQDTEIKRLTGPLTPTEEQAAKNLPSAQKMIEEIGKGVGTRVPEPAHRMLCQFRDVHWKSLNSFVHAGIHPFRRHSDGYPLPLILDVLRNSNALSTMAGMVMAVLTGDIGVVRSVGALQTDFADCLPTLIATSA